MIKINEFESFGHGDYQWLNARYHFSFSNYHNPNRIGFGPLLVVNDDQLKAGAGFDAHYHKNMEIITYVRQGAITHKDSELNVGRTQAGDLQVMSAGKGIYHSEYNLESEDTSIYQIWIQPNQFNMKAKWESMTFPKEPVTDSLTLLVSGEDDGTLFIHQDAWIYGGRLAVGTEIMHSIKQQAYLLASKGEIKIDGNFIKEGDSAEITDTIEVKIQAITDAEIILIDVPNINNHTIRRT